jgi:crossover junction endodeoxyribonuclease RuvC
MPPTHTATREPGARPPARRVLGIDTSLRATGVAVVEAQGHALKPVAYETLRARADAPLSECLRNLSEGLARTIARTAPEAAAVEGVFYCKNVRTAVRLGEARGVAIAVCAGHGLPVFEYEPRRVKQALVGFGAADKSQVRKIVMRLLALDAEPPEDAGDALALAICHLHNQTRHALLMPQAI